VLQAAFLAGGPPTGSEACSAQSSRILEKSGFQGLFFTAPGKSVRAR
jgi:hypothetical protein